MWTESVFWGEGNSTLGATTLLDFSKLDESVVFAKTWGSLDRIGGQIADLGTRYTCHRVRENNQQNYTRIEFSMVGPNGAPPCSGFGPLDEGVAFPHSREVIELSFEEEQILPNNNSLSRSFAMVGSRATSLTSHSSDSGH